MAIQKLIIVINLLNLLNFVFSNEAVCGFTHNDCSYEIKLVPVGNCRYGDQIMMDKQMDSADYSSKMNMMERTFSDVRVDHEKRLDGLEKSVRELLGLDENSSPIDHVFNSRGKFQNQDNKEIVSRLHEEYTNLRIDIKRKNARIIQAEIKFNETNKELKQAQLDLFDTNQELLDAENKIAYMQREMMILRNQLKDKTYRLDASGKKASDCEGKTGSMQTQLFELVRSEATIKEDLETCYLEKNMTEKELQETKRRHGHLKRRHHDQKGILKIRENELINCYNAKTETFCGFEDPNLCGFTQINGTVEDFFDWTRGQGSTPSANTGPTKDHTCNSEKGHFMYIEASAKGKGNNAIMFSPLYRGLTEQCVEFYYHMNGRHVGTLNVYARARGAELDSVWRAFGNQGDVWSFARLGIPKELARAGYQIAFEGITESGYQGDISIDDVSVTDAGCPIDSGVTPVKVSLDSDELIKLGKNFARSLKRKKLKRVKNKKSSGENEE
ncbi:hypothetical protein LOTGIDRAFT_231436 [Lottia gigantea]|uniref:MAM domain-containing protein n=1 Tax=Lottia gigantea TaxID=225164 RepID=V4C9H0_LOTGI|nr:hypothetical protein LOTGIDRAFT_231436 [Lottia gigantea]ESO98389.1 hypothetical protein LOTGIDRAFT_231436 [Lottia gigantea]